MGKLKICPVCKNTVTPKKCSKIVMILLLCIGIVPGLIYYIVCGGNKCPICNYKF